MEDILYVKIEQNIPVTNRCITLKDIGSFYSHNKSITQKLEKEIFYTLPEDCPELTMFTITKVYEVIHRVYPNITIENLGETDFIVELRRGKTPPKAWENTKVVLVSLVLFFGAAFTIMTFDEDVSVSRLFQKIYQAMMGAKSDGKTVLEFSYCLGLPIGILLFYNHFKKPKSTEDPTPIQVEMRTYEEQLNKALIKTSSREGKTIDYN